MGQWLRDLEDSERAKEREGNGEEELNLSIAIAHALRGLLGGYHRTVETSLGDSPLYVRASFPRNM